MEAVSESTQIGCPICRKEIYRIKIDYNQRVLSTDPSAQDLRRFGKAMEDEITATIEAHKEKEQLEATEKYHEKLRSLREAYENKLAAIAEAHAKGEHDG